MVVSLIVTMVPLSTQHMTTSCKPERLTSSGKGARIRRMQGMPLGEEHLLEPLQKAAMTEPN